MHMKKNSNWQYGISTHKGSVRQTNEDNAYLNKRKDRKGNELLVTVIADGMGGYDAGDAASELIVMMIDKWFQRKASALLALPYPFAKISDEIEQLLKEANEALLTEGRNAGKKMGSTASILFLYKRNYLIVHVGDSRIYKLTETYEEEGFDLNQLTEDHSWVADQVRKYLLSVEEGERHPKKNVIMQCVGVNDSLSPYIEEGRFTNADMFLLCSDRFYNIYPEMALLETIH